MQTRKPRNPPAQVTVSIRSSPGVAPYYPVENFCCRPASTVYTSRMKNPRTTVFGALAAAAAAVAALPALPSFLHVSAVVTAAASVALLGFFAADAVPAKKITPLHALALAGAATLIVGTGCTVGKLALGVTSPTFGSVDLSIGGGTVGNATLSEITTSNRTTLREVSYKTAATSTNRATALPATTK